MSLSLLPPTSTATMPTSIKSLSPCIILDILDLIRYDETRSPVEQARDLSSISRISKKWSKASQQLLFRNVHLTTLAQYTSFLGVAAANPGLASSVRQLKLPIHDDEGLINETHLPALLRACPRLYELDISCYNTPSFSAATLLKAGETTKPTALRYSNCTGSAAVVPYQLSHLWQDSLEYLILGGDPYCTLASPPVGLDPFSGKLKEFRWTGFDRPSDAVLEWFLPPPPPSSESSSTSSTTLRYLFLDSLPINPLTFDALLQVHGPNLRSLRLRDLFGVDAEALRHCTGLEEFGLDRGMDETILSLLPEPTITHLEFGVKVNPRTLGQSASTLASHLVKVVKPNTKPTLVLPRLRVVTLKQWGGTWTLEPTVKQWRGVLCPVGVDVVNGSPMKKTPSQRRNLPVSKITHLFDSTSFPRVDSPAVYRFMSSKALELDMMPDSGTGFSSEAAMVCA